MIGKTISHYKILEKLGEGGMGVVYKAEDTKLDRMVALKFLPPHISLNKEEKKRFIHEARAAAALNHLNIVTIHEINEFEGQIYIALEYLEGKTIKDKIEEQPLPLNEAIDIATQIAEGLNKAHKKDIIHRDIKSANIMVTEEGVAKILDFGLAKLRGVTKLTKEGTTLGTVAYMSPEQTLGENVDHRSDIWSLGVLLYEMITGQLPFKGEYEQAVMYSIMNEDPEPVTDVRPEVPGTLGQVVSKALEKHPEKRYQHLDELLDDLRSLSDGIVPDKIKARLLKAKLRKRKRTILYTGAAGLIIAAVILLSLFTGRTGKIDSIAVLPFKNLTGDPGQEYFVDGVTDELIGQLGQISGLQRVISRTSAMQYKETEKSLSEIARELNVDAVVEGTVYQTGDKVRIRFQLIDALPEERNLWGKTYERAKTDIMMLYREVTQAVADEIQLSLTSEEEMRLAKTKQVNPEAYEAYLKGKFHWNKFTEKDIEIARQYFELALEKDPDYAPAYSGIASYWGAMTYFGVLSSEAFPKRMAALDKCLELDNMLPEAHFQLAGTATWFEFDWDKAEREFRRALELNPNYAQGRIFYGLFLTGMGRFEEAKAQMIMGIRLDPINAMYQGYLGLAFLRARQFDHAIAQFKKSLTLQADFTDSLGGLVHCYHQKGMYEQAFTVRRKIFETNGARDLLKALDRGHKEGGYREAMRQVAVALEARSNRAYALGIASYYTYSGEKDRALDWLEIAYQERIQDLVYLNVYPKWDPLRNDPRFIKLVNKMNFPTEK